MLDHLGEPEAAADLDAAVDAVLAAGAGADDRHARTPPWADGRLGAGGRTRRLTAARRRPAAARGRDVRHHAAGRVAAGRARPDGRGQAAGRAALDALGVDVVEGGWPGSNPKDKEFFARAGELAWRQRPAGRVRRDQAAEPPRRRRPDLETLLVANTPIVTLVGKSWTLHVDEALRTTREENLAMIADSVRFFAREGGGSCSTPSTSSTATRPTGLCARVPGRGRRGRRRHARAVRHQRRHAARRHRPDRARRRSAVFPALRVGVHCHNDSACAVANSLVAVGGGATACAGRGQRLRRAVRERRPVRGHRRARAEA